MVTLKNSRLHNKTQWRRSIPQRRRSPSIQEFRPLMFTPVQALQIFFRDHENVSFLQQMSHPLSRLSGVVIILLVTK